jgi:hypothetical protein
MTKRFPPVELDGLIVHVMEGTDHFIQILITARNCDEVYHTGAVYHVEDTVENRSTATRIIKAIRAGHLVKDGRTEKNSKGEKWVTFVCSRYIMEPRLKDIEKTLSRLGF